jgi:MOSC domain-containing protein YiiM
MSDTAPLAVCVVRALRPDAGSLGVTAIDKAAVDGAVRLGRYGAYADVQAIGSTTVAGQGLYAYAQEDAEFWETEPRAPLRPGGSARTSVSRGSTSIVPVSASSGGSGRRPSSR